MTLRARVATAVALAGCGLLAAAFTRYSTGPDASYTGAPAAGGAPAEPNCSYCHSTYDISNGQPIPNVNLPGGGIEILDLPVGWRPGRTYTIRVRLASDSTVVDANREWGFQLTAIRMSDGTGAGTFSTRSPDSLKVVTGLSAYATRQYVEHTANDVQAGAASPVEWSFDWTAPSTPAGSILFAAAGNAANNNSDPSGDFIYTTSVAVIDTTTPALRTTWGALKARWR